MSLFILIVVFVSMSFGFFMVVYPPDVLTPHCVTGVTWHT